MAELQDILLSEDITGQKMDPAYDPSADNDIEIKGHNHDGVYEPRNTNIQQHIGSVTIHFTQAQISIPESQISDLNKYTTAEVDALVNAVEAAKEDDLGNPTITGYVLSSTTAGVRTWVPNEGEGGEGTTDHNVLVNRDIADQHPIFAVTGLQDGLDSKSDTGHDHNADYFQKSEFISEGIGAINNGSPIVLNTDGKIDPSFISISNLEFVDNWTPSGGEEYPDPSGLPNGSFWAVEGVDDVVGYTFTGGDLLDVTVYNHDSMIITSDGWKKIQSKINPDNYMALDGSNAMTGNMSLGFYNIINLAPGEFPGDAATYGQLTDGLDSKADTNHNHDGVYSPATHDHDTVYDAIGSASAVQTNLTNHENDDVIHYAQSAISITESQISDLDTYVPTHQEAGVGFPLENAIIMTAAEHGGIAEQPNVVYFIVG